MKDVLSEIALKYQFQIEGASSFKDTNILCTNLGKKVLKKVKLSPQRILFVHSAKEHIANNGFKTLDRYIITADGLPYAEVDGCIYTVTDSVSGRECNLDDRSDTLISTRLLAHMHKASKGYITIKECTPRVELGNLPSNFQKRLNEIKKAKKLAQKNKSGFDNALLICIDHFYSMGEHALDQLMKSGYQRLVEETHAVQTICHHEFTHNNIIFEGESPILTNFESSAIELKVYDLANLLRRKMRKCGWDIAEAKAILDEYHSVEPLCYDELCILKIMIQYPQKFWRIINRYYNNKRSPCEKSDISKLNETINEIPHIKHLLEQWDKIM